MQIKVKVKRLTGRLLSLPPKKDNQQVKLRKGASTAPFQKIRLNILIRPFSFQQ